jgi:hypothetical protein
LIIGLIVLRSVLGGTSLPADVAAPSILGERVGVLLQSLEAIQVVFPLMMLPTIHAPGVGILKDGLGVSSGAFLFIFCLLVSLCVLLAVYVI